MFKHLRFDLNAGLVVFLVAIPLCLGIALASKTPVMSGVLAGIIGGVVIGILGGSELGVSGPAAGLVAIVIGGVDEIGTFSAFCLATAIAGVIQFLLGAIKAGIFTSFFPLSVIKGMLAAIGIIIFLKQIPHAVGFDKDYEGDLSFVQEDGHNTFTELAYMLDAISPGAIIVSVSCLLLLILWETKMVKKNKVLSLVPGPLLAVVLGIGGVLLLPSISPDLAIAEEHLVQLPKDQSIAEWFTLPDFSAITNEKVWMYALIIALIASIESLLCAEATDKIDPQMRISDKNRELRAQGIGNLISGLVGGLPVTQVVVRSSANVQAGGVTRLSTILHGLLIFLIVALLPGLLMMIPNAALAAILLVIGFKLASPTLFKKQFKKGLPQFIPFIITIVAILATDLLKGVTIGLVVGIAIILWRNFLAPYRSQVEKTTDGRILITLKLAEIVSFLNKGAIIQTLQGLPNNAVVRIDGSDSKSIDPDVLEVIEDYIGSEDRKSKGIEITFDHPDYSQARTNELMELKNSIQGLGGKAQ